MTSICSENQKFQSFHHHINIPPRKLLSRKGNPDMGSESPRFSFSLDTLLQKFLPFNNAGDDDGGSDEGDPYSSDHFRMYEFKVRRCTRSRSHDWTDCPFAHPGEKARRRDPRRFHYSGTVCPEFRRGGCNRGDGCEFAHGVFECWLHPARYRTEACKDGKNCKRKICFFAHSPCQLRILPVTNSSPEIPSKNNHSIRSPGIGSGSGSSSNHCCMFCHCGKTSSPTSTLFNMSHSSPPHSPPLSPSMNGFSPVSSKLSGVLSYKDALTELMNSMESMNMTDDGSRMPWIDVSSLNNEDQLQFILSPSTPNFSGSRPFSSGDQKIDCSNNKIAMDHGNNKGNYESDLGCVSGPDLGWVNDLLM